MLETSHYDEATADYVVNFIGCLCHTKGRWAGKPFDLLPWQEQIIRDIFGTLKPNGKRQFTTAYIEIGNLIQANIQFAFQAQTRIDH